MMNHSSRFFWLRMCSHAVLLFFVAWFLCNSDLAGQGKEKQKGKGEPLPEDKGEQKEAEVPKPPPGDFMVSVYKALDEKQTEKISIKDKFKHYKEELDVEIELRYFNWALNSEDYWDRQIHLDIKLKDGYVVEKYMKSGFGEFGYIKPGDTETKDIYRTEKITESGGQSVATMCDCPIGAPEKQRFQMLLQKMVFKK